MKSYELKVQVVALGSNFTLSRLIGEGLRPMFVLEDGIRLVKIKHKTCIAAGRYEVVFKYSNRYQKLMPFLLDVPNFQGIMFHSGNTVNDTSGCLLVGFNANLDKGVIFNSREAFAELYHVLWQKCISTRVFLVIER